MPIVSVGDMVQQFTSMRNSGAIKTELSRLAESLSSGQVTDITAELGGETNRFSGINYTLTQLEGYGQVVQETSQTLAGMQLLLGKVNASRGETSSQLLLVSDESTPSQVNEAALAARGTFASMVNALNTQLADRALMGGTEVGQPPLASADVMLADLQTAIGGATTQTAISAAIDLWFDDPAGRFATIGYLGDTGPAVERRVSDDRTYRIDARADDPAIREVLKGAAFAAIANDLSGIDLETKSDLLQEAGQRLFVAADGIIGVQSRIGFIEAGVEQMRVEISSQRASLGISKNDLISADPFETASRLQSVQLQLETHYSVTARLSRLSLLDYI